MATQTPGLQHLLFTYGTLMRLTGFPSVDKAMKDHCINLGRAWIAGHLFDVGGYPGAISLGVKQDTMRVADMNVPKVWGYLYQVGDPFTLFSILDEYESFDASSPRSSEFIRSETPVTLSPSGLAVPSQTYFYNFPAEGLVTIQSGDYWEYLQAISRNP